MSGFGSFDRPVVLTPFQRIVEVGWGSGIVAIVTLVYDDRHADNVATFEPEFEPLDLFSATVSPTDYRDSYAGVFPNVGSVGSIVAEREIDGEIVVDASQSGGFYGDINAGTGFTSGGLNGVGGTPLDDDPTGWNSLLRGEIARQGRPPDLIFTGGSSGDVVDAIFTTVTQPDGTSVRYQSGWRYPVPSWVSLNPAHEAALIWQHTASTPARNAEIKRQSWLVNFRKGKTVIAAIEAAASELDYTATFTISWYHSGAVFTNAADGSVSTAPPAIRTIGGSISPAISGVVQKFDKNGLVT